jgi:hypothetical protein
MSSVTTFNVFSLKNITLRMSVSSTFDYHIERVFFSNHKVKRTNQMMVISIVTKLRTKKLSKSFRY